MIRKEAFQLLANYLKNENLIKHSLAAEVAMKGLYRHLIPIEQQNNQDEDKWGMTGLLHDIDYEIAQKENLLHKHGLLIFEKEPNVIPEEIAYAIKAHNFHDTNVLPQSPMDWSIVTADRLTGLIVAAALVTPEKKLTSLTVESVLKRFKEKSFAKGANRDSILLCESKLNIPLKKFVEIILTAMQSISRDLGL